MGNSLKQSLIICFFIVITTGADRDEGLVGLLGLFISFGLTIFAFFLACLSCCVVNTKNYGVALAFLILMIVRFILQLVAGDRAYKELESTAAHRLFRGGLMDANSNSFEVWNEVQSDLSCCGVNGPNDWLNRPSQVLPLSCCKIEEGIKGTLYCSIENAFKSGCLNNLREYIMSFAETIRITMALLAVVQVVGVFVIFRIARTFRQSNSTSAPLTEVNVFNIEGQPTPTKL